MRMGPPKSRGQSEHSRRGEEGWEGVFPIPQGAAGSHPGPLQGRGLRASLGALLQPRGIAPHVPVRRQTPATGQQGG